MTATKTNAFFARPSSPRDPVLSRYRREMKILVSRIRFLAVIAALALVAVACGGESTASVSVDLDEPGAAIVEEAELSEAEQADDTAQTETEAPETVEDDPLVEPDDSEAREELIAELTAALSDWQAVGGIPGASLSVRLPDQEPINIASGVRDLITEEPVTTDDFFRIGSITKPMTSAIVLQLVDEGLIELDEPVETYLPGWLAGYQYSEEITVRQLMDHTNGLVEYALDPGFYALAGQRSDQPLDPQEIRDWLATQEPLFAPGTQYQYETGGFLTLGDVIEAVTGNTAAAEMRARIFEPAGAENIYLTPQEFPPTPTINAYGRDLMYFAGTTLIGRVDTDLLKINDQPVIDIYGQPQEVLQSAGWTGGGNEAQLESVSAIIAALFDGTILSDDQIATMTAPVLDVNYALGIDNSEIDGERVFSHGGGVPGFRSQANYLPEHDISWAVSVNLIPLPEDASVGVLRQIIQPILVEAASVG